MAYIVKWADAAGRIHASEPQESPSDALRFAKSPQLAEALDVWAESDKGHRFPLGARPGGAPTPARLDTIA